MNRAKVKKVIACLCIISLISTFHMQAKDDIQAIVGATIIGAASLPLVLPIAAIALPTYAMYLAARTAFDRKLITVKNVGAKPVWTRIYFVQKIPEFKAISVSKMLSKEGYNLSDANIEQQIQQEKDELRAKLQAKEITDTDYKNFMKPLEEIEKNIKLAKHIGQAIKVEKHTKIGYFRPKRKSG